MVQMTGKFQQQKSENLDEYCKAVGMPYMARKIVGLTSPLVEIEEGDGLWIIKQSTMLKATEIKFKLNEEFDEHMPGGVLKSTGTIEDDQLIFTSFHGSGTKVTKIYQFDDPEYELIIVLCHEKSGVKAKRFFKRL